MFPPVQFLVMKMRQWKVGRLHCPWRLQLRYGITDNKPKNFYHVSLPALSVVPSRERKIAIFPCLYLCEFTLAEKNICNNRYWIGTLVNLVLVINTYGYWFLASLKESCFPLLLSFVRRMNNHKMRISICFMYWELDFVTSGNIPSGSCHCGGAGCLSGSHQQLARQLGA